jgi:hypothetical protein
MALHLNAARKLVVFPGIEPTGRSFRTMSLDLYTVANSQIVRAYHIENWTRAARQLAGE